METEVEGGKQTDREDHKYTHTVCKRLALHVLKTSNVLAELM